MEKPKILPDELLTEEATRAVRATLILAGHKSLAGLARSMGVNRVTMSDIICRIRIPGPKVAEELNRLLDEHWVPMVRTYQPRRPGAGARAGAGAR